MAFNDFLAAGVDIGNSYMKAVASNGNEVVFPLIIAEGKDRVDVGQTIVKDQPQENLLDVIVTEEGQEPVHYFFGTYAARFKDASFDNSENKAGEKALRAAMFTALALLNKKDSHIYWVCTGLPYEHYENLKSVYEREIPGKATVEFLNGPLSGSKRTVNILRAKTHIQGLGIYINELLDDNGNIRNHDLLEGKVGILDTGYRTTNFILVENGEVSEDYCTNTDKSMSNVINNLRKFINKEFNIKLELPQVLEAYESRTIRIPNPFSLKTTIDAIHKKLAEKITMETKQFWPDIRLINKIFIGGGGGIALGKHFPYSEKIIVEDQKANARGFLKAAKAQLNEVTGEAKGA